MLLARLCAGFLILLAAGLGAAQDHAIRSEGATVVVNGVPVFIFSASYSGLGPDQRAARFASRLRSSGGTIEVVGKRATRTIKRGHTQLAMVTSQDASANASTVGDVAAAWARSVRLALALPPLRVSERYLRLPVGTTKIVNVIGSKSHRIVASASDPRQIVTKVTNTGVEIRPLVAAKGTVTILAEGATETVSVEAWPYAASFPQQLQATVTGYPADEATVKGAIEGALRNQLKGLSGVVWSYRAVTAAEMEPGATRSFEVSVQAEGPKSFAAQGLAIIAVRSLALPRKIEGELWYCNDPESLKKPGPLFSAPMLRDAPVRMLYHHVNDAPFPMYVRIQVINDTDIPARVMAIPGDSKPDKNPVLAGLLAADQFVRSWVQGSGEIVNIPPRSTMPISLRRLGPGDTMSGLCALRLLTSGPDSLMVRADAIPPFELNARWLEAMASSAPWRIVGMQTLTYYDRAPTIASMTIYPNPFKEEEVNYQVGGRYGFVRIGQRPIARADQTKALDGNFGVVYTIKANASNPTADAAEIELVFEASAGYAGALFVVNGEVKRTHPIAPKGETQLVRFRLEPGGTKFMTIVGIPHSGGSYPATLTIRPVQGLMTHRQGD